MNLLRFTGPQRLEGTVAASGSKNAALPAMAACLLTDQPVELSNVPRIEDIETMAAMLRDLGVGVDQARGSTWRLRANRTPSVRPDAELARRLRGSVLMLGPLVARTGEALIPRPGGDDIGLRRLDQHLVGLRAMGASVEITEGAYVASARLPLHGARVDLDMPTVTGTENLMMAACLAEGITAIGNAAREPHVVDLARCLNGMGARITGAGSEQIVVEGTGALLHGVRHVVTSDYVEAGTYMVAAAATGGDVTLEQLAPADVRPLINKLRAAGCVIQEGTTHVRVHRGGPLRPVDVTTWPHPGFATDFQPQFVTLMTQAEGTSTISEAVHDNRFRHVEELRKLGARVTIDGRSAIVTGPTPLRGTQVRVLDIRSGAALVIAACCAEGVTEIEDVYHLDRGYEALVDKLRVIGAQVEQVVRPVEFQPLAGVTYVEGGRGLGGLAGLWAASLARFRDSPRLRRSFTAWAVAGLVLTEAFAVGVAQLQSRQAALVTAPVALAWWLAVTAVPVIGAALLTTPQGERVDRLGVPNGLTAMRAYSCAGLILCAFLSTPHRLGFILWGTIGALAALLDLLDGWIARRFGPLTTLGQALDPVMDCVFFSMAAVGNIALGIIPAWLCGLMLVRYLGPLLVGVVLQLYGRRPELSATPWGKRNTLLTGAVLAVLLLVRSVDGPVGPVALALGVPLLGTTTLLHFAVMARRERDAPVARPRGVS